MAPTACKRMVSGSISLSCSEYFSPFPHGTCSLSVSHQYLALPDGPGRFRQDFTCPALLRILLVNKSISNTGLSPFIVVLSKTFFYKFIIHIVVLQPQSCLNKIGLGCSHFAHRYSGNRCCFLFLRVIRCFSSPGYRPKPMCSVGGVPVSPGPVPRFGNPRLSLLNDQPRLFAVQPRPSSALNAKASTASPQQLDLTWTRSHINSIIISQ